MAGGRFGANINLTAYKENAFNFFNGEMHYTTETLPIGSLTEYYDATSGVPTGWTVGSGLGVGIPGESATSSSWAAFLQK